MGDISSEGALGEREREIMFTRTAKKLFLAFRDDEHLRS